MCRHEGCGVTRIFGILRKSLANLCILSRTAVKNKSVSKFEALTTGEAILSISPNFSGANGLAEISP